MRLPQNDTVGQDSHQWAFASCDGTAPMMPGADGRRSGEGHARENGTMSATEQGKGWFAHETAIVDEGAEIGAGTKIWHFSHVSSGARIGERCSLGQNVFVAPRVTVGDGVKIQNNVSLYEGVVLEDYVFCGPSMVFTNVRTPRSAFPRNTSADYATTRVRYGASIGANATIVCGATVGEWAFVAAGAVVTKDVPDYALMGRRSRAAPGMGVPLRRHAALRTAAVRRARTATEPTSRQAMTGLRFFRNPNNRYTCHVGRPERRRPPRVRRMRG